METPANKAVAALRKYPPKIHIKNDFLLYAKVADASARLPASEPPVSAHRGIMQAGRIRSVTNSTAQILHGLKDSEHSTALGGVDVFYAQNPQSAEHSVLSAALDASSLLEFYDLTKKQAEVDNLKLSDIILFAVSRTLPLFPCVNAHYTGNAAVNVHEINLGFGCDTDRGLLIPVISKANALSLLSLSKAVSRLTEEARSFRISSEKLTGGSFTVLNFGAYGVSFTPMVVAPQVGILNVNPMETKVKDMDGELKPYPSLSLSMSFNARAVDGVQAARFLNALCRNLERLAMLILR
jgi:pyruvate/2-oxoglutarate dehydrogenase complex dihydrolipoamide acyltransferase (E2) component